MADESEDKLAAAKLESATELYRIFSDTAESLFTRRAEANRFYLTLNLAVVGAIGFLFSDKFLQNGSDHAGAGALTPIVLVVGAVFAVAGLAICYNWLNVIRSHADTVRFKFTVLHEMERSLPFQPFKREQTAKDDTSRRPTKPMLGISRFERRLPMLFLVFYLLALLTFAALGWTQFGSGLAGLGIPG